MSYNPPELKQELGDTLFCIGIKYEYETIKEGSRVVRSFHLLDTDEYIDIYSANFVRFNRKKYDMYGIKCHLLQKFSHLI